MNIGIMTHYLYHDFTGGVEVLVDDYLTRLSRHHRLFVFTTSRSAAKYNKRNMKIITTGFPQLPFKKFTARIVRLIALLAHRKHLDLLYCFDIKEGFFGVIWKQMSKKPVIVSTHGFVQESASQQERWWRKFMTHVVLKNSDVVIAQTERLRQELLAVEPSAKVVVIPNGINLSARRKCETSKKHQITCIARLVPQKGHAYLFQALRAMKSYPRVCIIGDGPSRPQLEGMSRDLNVEFVGGVPYSEVPAHIKESLFVVLPSLWEAQPMVILEAMAHGIPVIATAVGGIPETVIHGKTGFLVEPKDTEKLAHCMTELVRNQALRDAMGRNARRAVRKYDNKILFRQIERLFNEVAEARSAS